MRTQPRSSGFGAGGTWTLISTMSYGGAFVGSYGGGLSTSWTRLDAGPTGAPDPSTGTAHTQVVPGSSAGTAVDGLGPPLDTGRLAHSGPARSVSNCTGTTLGTLFLLRSIAKR